MQVLRKTRIFISENVNVISYRLKSNSFVGKFNPEYKLHEEELPEYIYAGKNVKPHTRIYAMGVSTHGGLGIKTLLRPKKKGLKPYLYMHRPHRIAFAEYNKVTDIACGYGFTVFAVKSEKEASRSCFGTGITTSGQIGLHAPRAGHPLEIVLEPVPIEIPLPEETFVTKVACGRAHTIVSTNDNSVWTFGDNAYGQCGRPVVQHEDHSKTVIYHPIKFFKDRSIEQIECGQDTSFILSDGTVFSCGWSADGQTGRSTFKSVDSFGPVEGDIKGEKIIKISSKADCALALNDEGKVFGWGNSEYNQLASITDEEQVAVPRYLPLKLPKVVDISASGTACYAVTEDGDVYSWGYGSLGRGPNETECSEPKLIPSTLLGRNILNKDSKVQRIFTGITMAAALTNQGGLYTWGRNNGGCLGLGDTKSQYFPLRVCIAGFVKKVSCGVDHMIVMAKSVI